MKKTIIALMALACTAMASETMNWSGSDYDLSNQTTITASTIGNTSGWIMDTYVDSNNTSHQTVAPFAMTLTFTLTQLPGSVDQHLVSFGATAGNSTNAYGFKIKTNGNLEFGSMGTDNITSTTAGTGTSGTTTFSALTTNTKYELTIISYGVENTAGIPGRGKDNFLVTVTNMVTGTTETKKIDGFGLNHAPFGNLRIGSAIEDNANVLKGTVHSISLQSIPEPATATLSLLALCGLAARRRRK